MVIHFDTPWPRVAGRIAAAACCLWLAACGSSDPAVENVTLSGTVSYDFVPAAATRADAAAEWEGGLDYARTEARPARGVQVVAVADDGQEIAATRADAHGAYTLTVPANISVRLRAKARLLQGAGAGAWDFSVRDNTSPGFMQGKAALYTAQGEAFDSGNQPTAVHNLHAASGWTGGAYTAPRAAAPFAILDQFYSAMEKMRAADPDVVFPPMNTYWSVENRPSDTTDKAIGDITTSHYWDGAGADEDDDDEDEGPPGLFILGKADVDTDEYDTGVVVHEWGHYFEAKLSRSDSTGGSHGGGDVLDMRLAFGEAWGNALAGMVRGDPLYVDTNGPGQASVGPVLDLDDIPSYEPKGWFNEASVQYVLYQISKAPELGFGDVYRVMTGPQKTTPAFTSLFSFAAYLREIALPAGQARLDELLAGIGVVHGAQLDIWGSGQTWPASLPDPAVHGAGVLPIYTMLQPGQAPVKLCTTNIGRLAPGLNMLGNRRYLRLSVNQPGDYQLKLAFDGEPLLTPVKHRGADVPFHEVDDDTVGLRMDEAGDYLMAIGMMKLGDCFTAQLQ